MEVQQTDGHKCKLYDLVLTARYCTFKPYCSGKPLICTGTASLGGGLRVLMACACLLYKSNSYRRQNFGKVQVSLLWAISLWVLKSKGWNVAQLAEHWTKKLGATLMQVGLTPQRGKGFFSQSQLSVQILAMFAQPAMHVHL